MRKILAYGIMSLLLVSTVITTGWLVAASLGNRRVKAAEPSGTVTTVSALYTLSEYDGKVALYRRGCETPIEIFDVYLSTLPDEARSQLAVGITASSDEEAEKLIEDYTS